MGDVTVAVHALTVDKEKNEDEWTNSLRNLFKDVLHFSLQGNSL